MKTGTRTNSHSPFSFDGFNYWISLDWNWNCETPNWEGEDAWHSVDPSLTPSSMSWIEMKIITKKEEIEEWRRGWEGCSRAWRNLCFNRTFIPLLPLPSYNLHLQDEDEDDEVDIPERSAWLLRILSYFLRGMMKMINPGDDMEREPSRPI